MKAFIILLFILCNVLSIVISSFIIAWLIILILLYFGKMDLKTNYSDYENGTSYHEVPRKSFSKALRKGDVIGKLLTFGIVSFGVFLLIVVFVADDGIYTVLNDIGVYNYLDPTGLLTSLCEKQTNLISLILLAGIILLSVIKKVMKATQWLQSFKPKLFGFNHKDLFYLIPEPRDTEFSAFDLVHNFEKKYDKFLFRYSKKSISCFEFITMEGTQKYRYKWAMRARKHVLRVVVLIVLLDSLYLAIVPTDKTILYSALFLCASAILLFIERVKASYRVPYSGKKEKLSMLLDYIFIRYIYSTWGFYIVSRHKEKFVGEVQLLSISKWHRMTHSILDISALIRLAAYKDKFENTDIMSMMGESMCAMFLDSSDNNTWWTNAPVYVFVLFYYWVHNEIPLA